MSTEDDFKPVRSKGWSFGLLSTEEFGEEELVLGVLEKKRVFRFHGSDKEFVTTNAWTITCWIICSGGDCMRQARARADRFPSDHRGFE